MKAGKILLQAMRGVRRYGLRSVLMMLGVLIGIASLAVLSSIGEATKRETMQRFKNMLGTFDAIIVRPGAGRTRGMPTLVNVPPTLLFEDAAAISELSEIKAVAEVQNAFDIDVKYRDHNSSPAIFGVSSNWLTLRSEDVAQGSFFTVQQNTALARVAVLGPDVRSRLFSEEEYPLGKTVRIAEVPFEVIGLLKSRGAGPAGASLDNVILIPISTASRRLFNRDFLTMLIAQVRDPERSSESTAAVAELLRRRHHIRPPALDDFTITNPAVTMAQVSRAGSTLAKILTGVSAMALLIGGIVIMSLMSIAVSERRKEIGVRRSLGAARPDVVLQFLFEAIFVSLAGGVSGVLIGWGGLQLVSRIQKLPLIIVWQPFAAAVILSLALGVVFGLYPAWKASRVDPIQALRS